MTRLLGPLLLWAAGVAMTTIAAAPVHSPQEPKAEKFSHAQHVPALWVEKLSAPEVWRDCRGCHVFDAKNAVSAPQQLCGECHVGKGQLRREFAAGWTDDLGGYRTRTRDAFRHHTHHMLECRECHLPYKRNNLSDFEVVTGPGQCARCHEQQPEEKAVAMVKGLRWFRAVQDERGARELELAPFTPPPAGGEKAYADKLVSVFAGPAEGINKVPPAPGGDFDHDDHAGIGCVDCHTNIPAASAKDVGTGQIATRACATCHVGPNGPLAAAPAPKPQQRELRTLGTFTHADHYRFLQQGQQPRAPAAATEAAAKELKESPQNGCGVCHVQEQAAVGLVQPDFPFKAGFSKYTFLDCARCHDVDGWRTGESASKPLHDSADGKADGSSGWGACAPCHVPGTGKMATERPQVAVERFAASTFRFTTHTHPDITTAGADQMKSKRDALADCASCHRAKVPELPSRLAERPFRHATHLGSNATAKDCAVCHPSAERAPTAEALASDYRTYTVDACKTCHWGGPVTEVVAAGGKPASRSVVRFPHGPHVQAGAACTACHEVAADGGDVTTKASALACNLCHDHRPGGDGKAADPKAEGLFAGEATSCVRCHHEPVPAGAPGAPAAALVEAVPPPRAPSGTADPRHRFETSVFAGFQQPQYHPPGQACKDCHTVNLAPEANFPGIKRKRVDHVFAARPGKVHGDGVKEPTNCLACHWTSRSVVNAVPAIDSKGERMDATLRARRAAPDSSDTRIEFGNRKASYPGQKSDG